MATGSARYLRYLLFAFFGVTVVYFLTSSSIPTSNLPAWKPPTMYNPAKDNAVNENAVKETPAKEDSAKEKIPDVSPTADVKVPEKTELSLGGSGDGTSPAVEKIERMNATFVTLARNSDVWEIAKSIRHVEDRFNHRYHYDWVFLNDQEFDDAFKKVTSSLASGKTHYGLIPPEHWSFPDFIDQEKARKVREDMGNKKIIYGDSISYRHMCRYESGFFFRHELMNKFEWYWRVEPSIEFFCDIDFDPFRFMKDNKKIYSFVLSLYEYVETIPTLWDSVKSFVKKHPEHIAENNALEWLSDDNGDSYNHCHFWSNFEIGNLNWLRSKAYIDYFESLDRDGGFFYERWGDAPVHSIAAGLLLKLDQIHFFDDIAYYHVPFTHCPTGEERRLKLKCHCNPADNFDWNGYSCTNRWFDVNKMDKPAGFEKEQ